MTLELDEMKAQLARRDQEAARLKQDLDRQRAVAAEAEKRCDRLKTLRARLAAGSFKSSLLILYLKKCSRFHTILQRYEPDAALRTELDDLRKKNRILDEEIKRLRHGPGARASSDTGPEGAAAAAPREEKVANWEQRKRYYAVEISREFLIQKIPYFTNYTVLLLFQFSSDWLDLWTIFIRYDLIISHKLIFIYLILVFLQLLAIICTSVEWNNGSINWRSSWGRNKRTTRSSSGSYRWRRAPPNARRKSAICLSSASLALLVARRSTTWSLRDPPGLCLPHGPKREVLMY